MPPKVWVRSDVAKMSTTDIFDFFIEKDEDLLQEFTVRPDGLSTPFNYRLWCLLHVDPTVLASEDELE
jgi:hypothetical protein